MKLPGLTIAAVLVICVSWMPGCTRPSDNVNTQTASLGRNAQVELSATPQTSNDSERETEFRLEAREGNVKQLKAMLDAGVNVNAKDEFGWTALREAVFQENLPTVKFLLANRADPNGRDVRDGTTALSWAAETGQTEVVKALLDAGADPNVHDTFSGMTPLAGAAGAGRVDVVKLLIAKGADVNAKDKFGDTMLPEVISSYESALRSGRRRDAQALAQVIRILEAAGASSN